MNNILLQIRKIIGLSTVRFVCDILILYYSFFERSDSGSIQILLSIPADYFNKSYVSIISVLSLVTFV